MAESTDGPFQVVRGPWSTASIGDEVVEIFARRGGFAVEMRPCENLDQLQPFL